jgi:Zn-dependent alcohol dehydrogenase
MKTRAAVAFQAGNPLVFVVVYFQGPSAVEVLI